MDESGVLVALCVRSHEYPATPLAAAPLSDALNVAVTPPAVEYQAPSTGFELDVIVGVVGAAVSTVSARDDDHADVSDPSLVRACQ
jgi:Na+-driven multidrug efflux pump